MGLKTQFQKRLKQAEKRKKKRRRLAAKGQNVNDFFYGQFYLKAPSSESKGA